MAPTNPFTRLTGWTRQADATVTTTPSFVRKPKPPAAVRPIDIVGLTGLLDRRPEKILALDTTSERAGFAAAALGAKAGTAPIVKPPQPAARGPEQILGRLQQAGATVSLAADGEHLVVSAARGVVPKAGVVEVIDRYQRLLAGHLKGEPVMCEIRSHKTPKPAVSIVLGGAAACEEHLK